METQVAASLPNLKEPNSFEWMYLVNMELASVRMAILSFPILLSLLIRDRYIRETITLNCALPLPCSCTGVNWDRRLKAAFGFNSCPT
jgi:hypothetical protein